MRMDEQVHEREREEGHSKVKAKTNSRTNVRKKPAGDRTLQGGWVGSTRKCSV